MFQQPGGGRAMMPGGDRAIMPGGDPSIPGTAGHTEASIVIQTKDNAVMTFHDGWGLTWSGVRGSADISTGEGTLSVPDTTISYWNIDKAEASRRDNTTRQFLLTILGVILVIGLAAIILYAAFIATDR